MNKCEVIYMRKKSIKRIFFCVVKRVTVSYRNVIFIYSLLVQSVWKMWESIPKYKQNMEYWNELLKIESFVWSIVWGTSSVNQHPCHHLLFCWTSFYDLKKKEREISPLPHIDYMLQEGHRIGQLKCGKNNMIKVIWINFGMIPTFSQNYRKKMKFVSSFCSFQNSIHTQL